MDLDLSNLVLTESERAAARGAETGGEKSPSALNWRLAHFAHSLFVLSQQFFHYLTRYISEPEVAPHVPVGERFVV